MGWRAGAASLLLFGGMVGVSPAGAATYGCFGEPATIVGTNGRDKITGTNGPDVIVALGGADYVDGKGGDDLICLGRGGKQNSYRSEWARGGRGNDKISGGPGADHQLFGGPGRDVLIGGAGPDTLFGEAGRDRPLGGPGADHLNGGNDNDVLRGGGGDDFLEGDSGNDRIIGGAHRRGDAVSYVYRYQDRKSALTSATSPAEVNLAEGTATGDGTDALRGIENIIGTEHDDVLIGDDGPNLIQASGGDDSISAGAGDDCVEPSRGMNAVDGGAGFDSFSVSAQECRASSYSAGISPTYGVTVDLAAGYAVFDLEEAVDRSELVSIESAFGTMNQDALLGDDGPNKLFGGGGPDRIEGRGGDDYLDGGAGGGEQVDGGDGWDTCFGEVVVFCEN